MTFEETGLSPELLAAITERGFESPTPIQAEMIPFLLSEDGDVIGLAQTGTGKTAAFGLPILQALDPGDRRIQGLVLCPTRELCLQVSREISGYGGKLGFLKTATVYGGTAFGPQIRDLKAGSHIVTATPGRLRDLLEKNVADLSALRFLVLDEADQMLDMGFKDDLDAILETASPDRRTLLFSATMPPEVARIAERYMNNPREIVAGGKNEGVATVEHKFYRVHASDKYAALRRLIDANPDLYGIVFCRTRDGAKNVAMQLGRDGYSADALHGELSQVQRESVMKRFRQGNPSLLVATDVAARGLDVSDLTHVIHYDLPDEAAVYNHRSGRTGRAGKSGISLALIHLGEGHRIGRIERVLGRKISPARIPGGREICESRLAAYLERVASAEADESALAPYMETILAGLGDLDRDALIRRFVSAELGRYLEEYGNAPDLNPPPPPQRSRRDAERSVDRGGKPIGGMVRFRINLGRRQGVLPPQIIGMVNKAAQAKFVRLGRIDINTDWSDVQVEASSADLVERALRGSEYRGVVIRIERLRDGRGGEGRPGGAYRKSWPGNRKDALRRKGDRRDPRGGGKSHR